MITYSPYDKSKRKAYPTMLVKTSFNDSQVMYWEPAKYVAKMRATRTDHNNLISENESQPCRTWWCVRPLRSPERIVLRLRVRTHSDGNSGTRLRGRLDHAGSKAAKKIVGFGFCLSEGARLIAEFQASLLEHEIDRILGFETLCDEFPDASGECVVSCVVQPGKMV